MMIMNNANNTQQLFDHAQKLRTAGFEVIPVDPVTKSPGVPGWSTRTYTVGEVKEKLNQGWGISIRNHECIDFDNKGTPDAKTLFSDWKTLVEQKYPGEVEKLLIEQTQHGGFHVVYRCSEVEKSQKLAKRPATPEELAKEPKLTAPCLIETKGLGGQFLVSPTPGYTILQGDWFNLFEITPEQRTFFLDTARSLDRMPKVTYTPRPYNGELDGTRPGDIYNQTGGIQEALGILEKNGWTVAYSRGDTVYLTRPGKKFGVSGTYGHVAPGVFYCFTSSGSPFEPDTAYSPFQVFALLKHDGDFPQAAKELSKRYSLEAPPRKPYIEETKTSMVNEAKTATTEKTLFSKVPDFNPVLLSDLKKEDCPVEWLWEGYIARGHITLLAALWKAGKTTFLAELFRCMSEGTRLAGQQVHPCPILYLSEERTTQWITRRDEKNIIIPVHLLCNPLKRKLDYGSWVAWIERAANYSEEKGIQMVIIDTLTTFSSVIDENDSMQVNAALLPLNYFREKNIAVLLVHHFRKSGGNEGTASRGSGALMGYVDIIMEFSRLEPDDPQGTQRKLVGLSRFDETPAEIILDYIDGEYSSQVVTSSREARKQNKAKKVLELIRKMRSGEEIEETFTSTDLYDHWDDNVFKRPTERTIRNYLNELITMEKLIFSTGIRNNGKYEAKKYTLNHGNNNRTPYDFSAVKDNGNDEPPPTSTNEFENFDLNEGGEL